jgi:hypothetical protein
VENDGLVVTAGGLSVLLGGAKVTGGLSVETLGATG